MSQAAGQPSDATLISGDSMIGEVAAMGQLGPGKTFAGRYTLIARLGVGATGVVHAAHDTERDCKVAIKLLRPNLGDAAARAAQRVAALAHPNLIAVHEVGIVHEVVFVVMDYVDGGSLRSWIDAGPHPWPLTLKLFRAIAAGLAAAHRADLFHGKLEPEQVLLTAELEPRITDFGLVTEPADPRADQLGFCVAFYEALYGEPPLASRIREAPARAKVPTWLRDIVVRGLARDPTQRWPSMDALLEALAQAQTARRLRVLAGVLTVIALFAAAAALALSQP